MPRILIADDNSNIHRTVTLALKEAGVEVVAVGNGEAAVRKIAEIKPDLVLADIFMPVRNGYEVCQFVKSDPHLAHIPVVLLIGAFDPFDEREAQRVKADAILKKPFVPPDSLTRTVTDLLAQVAPKAQAEAPTQASEPKQPPRPSPKPEPVHEFMDEGPESVVPAKPKLHFDSNDQTLAFGTLLESSPLTRSPDETVITARRDPNLGEPVFWAPKSNAEPSDEMDADSEQQEAAADLPDDAPWTPPISLDDMLASATAQAKAAAELPSLLDLPEPEAQVDPESLAELLPQPPVLESASDAVPELLEIEPQPESEADVPTLELAQPMSIDAFEKLDPFSGEHSAAEPAVSSLESEAEPVETLKALAWTNSSIEPKQESEEKAPLAETVLDVEHAIQNSEPALASLAPFLASLTSAAKAREAASAAAFEQTQFSAFQDLKDEEEHAQDERDEEAALLSDAQDVIAEATSRIDSAMIEAIAQRVIERMQPQIIELVTRELLRPAVEALVQRELARK